MNRIAAPVAVEKRRAGAGRLGLAVLVLLAGGPGGRSQESALTGKAAEAVRAGRFQEAEQLYERLAKARPGSAEAWSNLGAVQVMAGECRKAGPSLARARQLSPRLFTPWYLAGVCESREHRHEAALADFRRAVEINPQDANAWYMAAQSADALNQVGWAFKAMVMSLRLRADRPEGFYQAAKLALDLASACYARVMAAGPGSPYPHRLEGERNAAQGVWALAISSDRQALERDPRAADIRFALGTAYLGSGQLREAEAEFRRCLELAPQSAWAKIRLALVLAGEKERGQGEAVLKTVSAGRLAGADELADFVRAASALGEAALAGRTLNEAARRFPGDARWIEMREVPGSAAPDPGSDARELTGVGFFVRFMTLANPGGGNFVEETLGRNYAAFRTAFLGDDLLSVARLVCPRIEPIPADPKSAFVLGEILQWLAYRLDAGLEMRSPDSVAAKRLMAENLSAAGEQEKALAIYRQILDQDGPSADILQDVAKIYWTQHRWHEALKALETLVEMDPRDSLALVNIGRIYLYQQNLASAQAAFERARQIDPRLYEAHLGLGETLHRRGEDGSAARELETAARLEPGSARPHYMLAEIYRKLGSPERAAEEMASFRRLQADANERARRSRDLVPLD